MKPAHPEMLVSLDTRTLWDVVLAAQGPRQFVATSDLEFLKHPALPGWPRP